LLTFHGSLGGASKFFSSAISFFTRACVDCCRSHFVTSFLSTFVLTCELCRFQLYKLTYKHKCRTRVPIYIIYTFVPTCFNVTINLWTCSTG
jgi:hypothetical protein